MSPDLTRSTALGSEPHTLKKTIANSEKHNSDDALGFETSHEEGLRKLRVFNLEEESQGQGDPRRREKEQTSSVLS